MIGGLAGDQEREGTVRAYELQRPSTAFIVTVLDNSGDVTITVDHLPPQYLSIIQFSHPSLTQGLSYFNSNTLGFVRNDHHADVVP